MYYEEIFQLDEGKLKDVYFKIKKIKPTKLFAYQTLFGQAFSDTGKVENKEDILQKCYDFIIENTLFSRNKEGQFIDIILPGLDNYNLEEIESDATIIGYLTKEFMTRVTKPIEKK